MDEQLKKLYEAVNQKGLYTKSFDDFKSQFSNKESQGKLYAKLNSTGLYTKGLEDFEKQFFVPKNTFHTDENYVAPTEPVKKKDDTVVPSGASDSQLVQPSTPLDSTSQEVSVDPIKPVPSKQVAKQKEEIAWYTDLSTRFKRGGLTALAGVAGIPNFINKLTASIVLDEESLREINSLPPAAREAVLATGNPAQMSLIANSAEAQNFLTEKADKLAGKIIEYEGNIIDDFGNGNIGQGVYRALQGVVESAPSMIMAMAPGGLAVIGAGTAAQKQEEQEKEGGKVNLASTVNSVINGVAEYYFERYTQQRLEPIKKMVVGEMAAAKEVAENMVGTLVKDIWGEAQSEAWTTVVQDLSDKLVAGKDISLIQIAKNVVDAGIIGGAMGGGIGGANVAAAKTMQAYTATKTMSTEKKKAIVEAKEVSESLKKELNLTDSKNVQDILKSKIEEVDQKVAEAKQAEIDKIENLSDEQVKQVFEIDQQMKEINDEYKAVVKNTEMSPDAKDIVEKELNVKFKELEAQKEKVLTTSTPTVATTEAPTIKELQNKRETEIKEIKDRLYKENTPRYTELLKTMSPEEALSESLREYNAAVKEEINKLPEIPKTKAAQIDEKGSTDFKNITKDLGFKESGKTWNDTPLGDDVGMVLQNENKNAAIFITPHEIEFYDETEDTTDDVTDGINIELLVTKPEARGQGEAKKLLSKVVKWADNKKADLFLTIVPQDKGTTTEGLQKLYEGFGFKFDGIKGSRLSSVTKPVTETTPKKEVVQQKETFTDIEQAEKVNTKKATNKKDLATIYKEDWGLSKQEADAAAVVSDLLIGTKAEREGISKEEMYGKIDWRKGDEQTAKDLKGKAEFQVDAWHGSPYQFDKFTTDKIGTGEGAQAFGWGLYFTDLEGIARSYADNLGSRPKLLFDGVDVNGADQTNEGTTYISDIWYYVDPNNDGLVRFKSLKQVTKMIDVAEEMANSFLNSNYDRNNIYDESYAEESKNVLEGVKYVRDNFDKLKIQEGRNLYKVNIHKGKTPEQYTWLEWDKPINEEQRSQIATGIKKIVEQDRYNELDKAFTGVEIDAVDKNGNVFSPSAKLKGMTIRVKFPKNITGVEAYNKISFLFSKFDDRHKRASLFLLENGIDGIKYPAESVARGATSDNARGFNYVVFDENAVEIEEQILFQKQKAAIQKQDGRYVIYALTDPDVSSPLHELAHLFEDALTDAEIGVIKAWAKTGEWTRETSEKFARGFEKYLATGVAPSKELKSIFEKFKAWLTEIYNGIKGSEIDIELNDAMKEIYSKMLGYDVTTETNPAYKQLADTIRSGKFYSTAAEAFAKMQSSPLELFKFAWDGALETIATVVEFTGDVDKAIKVGLKEFKDSAWYKALTKEERVTADEIFRTEMADKITPFAKAQVPATKEKPKTTIRKTTGQVDLSPKVVSTEAKLLVEKFRNMQRGFKTGVKETKELKADFIKYVKQEIKFLGNNITNPEIRGILNLVERYNGKNTLELELAVLRLQRKVEERILRKKYTIQLKKLVRKAVKTSKKKYNRFGENVLKLASLPIDWVQDQYIAEYYSVMEMVAKDKVVDFDRVNTLYHSLKDDIETFAAMSYDEKRNAMEKEDEEKLTEEILMSGYVDDVKNTLDKSLFKDYELEIVQDFLKIPKSYLISLPKARLNEINKALVGLLNGYLVNKTLSSVTSVYKAKQNAGDIITTVGKNELKPLGGLRDYFNSKFKDDLTSEDFEKKFFDTMLQHIDLAVRKMKGSKLYTHIIHPITAALNTADTDASHINDILEDKLREARRSRKNPSDSYFFDLNTIMQFYLRQREFLNNPELQGKKVFTMKDHMDATVKLAAKTSMSDITIERIQELYDKFADGNGEIDIDKIENYFTKEEKAIVDLIDEELAVTEEFSRIVNDHTVGESLTYPKSYFPRKNSVSNNNVFDGESAQARITNAFGSTTATASASNERIAGATALDFNTLTNFMTHVKEGHAEYRLVRVLKEAGITINELKNADNVSLVKLAIALERAVNVLIDANFNKNIYAPSSKSERLFKGFVRSTFKRMLIDLVRFPIDYLANALPIYSAYAKDVPKMKEVSKKLDKKFSEILNKEFPSTQAGRLGGSRGVDFKGSSTSLISQSKFAEFEPQTLEQLTDFFVKNKITNTTDIMSNMYYKIVDAPARHLWKLHFASEFEKITGEEIDVEKFKNDKQYRTDNKEAITKAVTKADKSLSLILNTAAQSEQKLNVQKDRGFLKRLDSFMKTFSFNENRAWWDSLYSMLGQGTMDSKSEAAKLFFIINTRSLLYSMGMQTAIAGITSMVKSAFDYDDDEDKEILEKAAKRSIAQHIMLIAFGNVGVLGNLLASVFIEEVHESVFNAVKDEGSPKYNSYEDAMVYTIPDRASREKYLSQMGAEGYAIASMYETAMLTKKIVDKYYETGEITKEDLITLKTAQISISFLSQLTGAPIDRTGKIMQKTLEAQFKEKGKGKATIKMEPIK